MSARFLYRALGVRGYRWLKESFEEQAIVVSIAPRREEYRCSVCGSDCVQSRGGEERLIRTVPLGSKPVYLFLKVPRVECGRCGHQRQLKLGFADPRRRYTRSFERYVLELSRRMTILDVARHLEISWDVVKEIQKRHLVRHYSRPRLKEVRLLGIDEIHVGRKGGYLTVVMDLESGAVIFVGEGKSAKSLDPFWRRLRGSGAKIRAVATDMGAAYMSAVAKHLPKAVHVLDHFHVVKRFNEKLTELRRELHRKAADEGKAVLKGIRWLLLKNPENLDIDKDEPARLVDALELNKELATAYYLKEDLRQVWWQRNKANAARVLTDWIRRANASGIRILKQFANTLTQHQWLILNYYDFPISTGPLERVNGKIGLLNRQAHGYRDRNFFLLKIYALHKTKHALVG